MRNDTSAPSADGTTTEPTSEIKRLALQLAAVVDALERRSADAVAAIDDGRLAVTRAASELAQRGPQLVAEVSRHAQAETRAAAERALAESVAAFRAQLDAAAGKANHSVEHLEVERRALARQQRSILWIGGGALVLGALLVVGGSVAWVATKRAELEQVEFARQIYDATTRGALVPCGEALCVRVGEKPRRTGERGEFLVVE
jgi:hypothetical protein